MSVFTMTQEQTKDAIKLHLESDLPLLITSVGGAGKSSIVKQVADEYGLEVIDLRLSQLTRFDLLGYPSKNEHTDRMEFNPLDTFPLENDPLPNGKQGWLIFLDELLQADKYVQGASFKLLLDRMVGNHKLHPNVRIIAAGNGTLNSNADNKLIAPLKSRFSHINMVINNQEFKSYVENQVNLGNWSPLILGFINFRPEYINNFDANTINDVTTYSSPRTLEMLSKLVQNGLLNHPNEFYEPMITGVIGESAGIDFNSYVGVYKSLPDINNIINDPANCVVPESVGAQWALSTLLLEHINPNVTKQFAEYIDRIDSDEVKVVIYRTLLKKCPAIAREPVAAKAMGLLKVKVTAAQSQVSP